MSKVQAIRVAFKDLSVEEQKDALRCLILEHAYRSGVEGRPFGMQPMTPDDQAAYDEGKRHREEAAQAAPPLRPLAEDKE